MALVSVCMGVHTSICTYVHMHTCARMCEKNVKNIHLSVHVCTQKRYLFVCVHICVEVFMLIHVIFG